MSRRRIVSSVCVVMALAAASLPAPMEGRRRAVLLAVSRDDG